MGAVLPGLALLIGAGCGPTIATPQRRPGLAAGASSAPATRDQFPRGYDALSYDLDLTLDVADGSFEGSLALVIASRRPSLADVDLDAVDLVVDAVTEGDVARRFRVEAAHLLVTLDPPAPDGTTRTLRIRYRGRPSQGLKWFDDHVYTAFHTQRWMPCDFDPGDKATFTLSLSVPPGWTALGNGEPRADRRRWSLTTPHSAYLFGFVAGRLSRSGRAPAGALPALDVLATPRTPSAIVTRLLDETPGMIRFFEESSGVPFPGARYGAAFVAGGAAQELASLSLLGDDYAGSWAAAPAEDWLAVHELSHQWWGNAATCATWGDDFWIQEAFAVFMTAAYKQRRWGEPAYQRERDRARSRYDKLRAAGRDRALALGPGAPVAEVGGTLVYTKGPLVLFDLRQELGEAAFWSGVRTFTRQAIAGASRTTDLQRIFEQAAGRPLPIFARAVYAAGAP